MQNSDPVFIEEDIALKKTVRSINNMIIAVKNDADSANVRFFNSSSHSKEAYSELIYERTQKEKNNANAEEYQEIVQRPYFHRLDFINNDGITETLYIGERQLSIDNENIYSWAALGEAYVRNLESITLPDGTFDVTLKRRFDISNSRLIKVYPEYDASHNGLFDGTVDSYLKDLLIQKKTEYKLTNIIRTIQENQWNIITSDINKSFVVQGCAGSGKTMILLHRLSYIKYNRPNLDLNAVKILTPSKQFNSHILDLVKNIDINDIEVMDVLSYYLYLLRKYESNYGSMRWIKNYSRQYNSIVVHHDSVDEKFLDSIYSESFSDLCAKSIDDYFDSIENEDWIDELKAICANHSYQISLNAELNERYRGDVYRDFAQRILDRNDEILKENNTQYKILQRKQDLSRQATRKQTEAMTKLEKEAKALQTKLKKSEKTSNTAQVDELETKLLEIWILIDALKPDLLNAQETSTKASQELTDFENQIGALASRELKIVRNLKKHLEPKTVFEATVGNVLKTIFDECGVDWPSSIKHGEFSRFMLYTHLVFWSWFMRGDFNNGDKYLHIDEAQDFTVSEYKLLSKINKNVVLNLYGDTNQLINNRRGISNWEWIKSSAEIDDVFILNENYRNTIEITVFCNKSFSFDAVPIGANGSDVRIITTTDFSAELKTLKRGKKRIAVMANDESVFNNNRKEIAKMENMTWLPIKSAKGLEFDIVYVFDKLLTKNEKYIAYTRALSELVIIK
ncbi:MAG: AAA family ATPase [Oscillospiraceae bacterium]|nr:AAA family ATPase [Oscillospiraceae bacterium]